MNYCIIYSLGSGHTRIFNGINFGLFTIDYNNDVATRIIRCYEIFVM